ncbi:MAG TPA: tetratricopeptide repeat protein [Thermoguttaceae bacterium]|nr:tetratricopeptide repeat protein [Thermoguttaceae bacterium]
MTQHAPAGALPNEGDEGAAWDTTRKVLNVRLLLGTFVAVVVLGVAAYVWRSYQSDRIADALMRRAETFEKAEEWEEAAECLRRYLRLRPNEAQVFARLAEVFVRSAETIQQRTRAVELYYRALGSLGAQGEDAAVDLETRLRSRLAELLVELSPVQAGYSTAAEREALLLLEPADQQEAWRTARDAASNLPAGRPDGLWWVDHPEVWEDARGARLWVLAIDRQVKDGAFVARSSGHPPFDEHFRRAVELNPGDVELSTVLARIYREQPQLLVANAPELTEDRRAELAGMADALVNDMVAAKPEDPDALLARYRYRTEYGLPDAKEDLTRALQFGPDNVAVLLAAARDARKEAGRMREQEAPPADVDAKYEEACVFCRRAIEAAPSEEGGYLSLGNVLRAHGRADEAIEAWRRGLAACDEESLTLHTRLAETLIAEGRLDQAEHHLKVLSRVTTELTPQLNRDGRRWLGSLRDLLQGEWLVGQGRYAEAVPLLKRSTLGHEASEVSELELAQARQAWQLLGALYAERGQWDLAATARQEASKLEPADLAPRAKGRTLLSAADAWSMAGCPAMAIPNYEAALAQEDRAETWASLARARFQRQTELPSPERAWKAFDETLREAKARSESLAEPWRVTLVEAESMVAKAEGGGETRQAVREAAKLLRGAEEEFPDSETLFQTLVLVYEGLGLSADADRAIAGVDRIAGRSVAACVLRSRLYSSRKQYEKAHEVIEKGIQTLAPTARRDLQLAMLQLNLDTGELEAARRQLLELHERSPADVRFVWQLAELALERDDLEEAARWEDKLRQLEGPDGSYWRHVRARRLLAQARTADDPRLAEVDELQAYLQRQRRTWPAGYVLDGLLCERLGRFGRAIAAYEKAIQFGERRISVYERLIVLLYRKQRFDEAQRYLSQLHNHAPSSPTLSTLEIHVAAQLGDLARALEAARRGVESRPEDPMARIWLAQMLVRNGQTQEAEDALLEAVRLAPDDRSASEALFTFYVDAGRLDQARDALERLAENPELSEGERALALAMGYDRIGDQEASETHYRELAQLAPNDVAVQKRLAAFLFDSDPEGAERALRRALRLAPDDREVRRALARLLTARGGLKQWQEAQQLIRQGGSPEGDSSVDRRLEAQLLVHRGGKDNLKKAKGLTEQLITDPETATAQDHLLLAALYEAEGKLYAADREYAALVEWAEPDPAHLISYVDFLLRHDRLYDADRWLTRLDGVLPKWLAKLEKRAPDRWAKVRRRAGLDATRLKARWLQAQGRTSEIKPLVDRLADALLKEAGETPEEKADVYRGLGDLCSAVDGHREAEHWYRLLADLIPERYEPLATATARQGRIDEAIGICVRAAESDDSPRPAIVLVRALASAQPSQEDLRLAEPFLAEAVEEHPNDVELLTSVAYVRCLQKRIDEAVRLYESILERRPQNLSVLNNLATVLAEQPARRKDALGYVDRAIAVAGPKAALLDTKGTILLLDGQAREAVELLEEASSLASDPRYLFHLALAYRRTGETDKARAALGKAHEGNLTGKTLTETDRRLLAELEAKLGR